MNSRVYSTEDAQRLAQKRLPRLVYDFIQGGAGREHGVARNCQRFDQILLQPAVMQSVSRRQIGTALLGREYGAPFGIAPMGMCNLVCPHADQLLANAARRLQIPVCLSSAGSTALERVYNWVEELGWFQLYFGQSLESTLASVDRAAAAGYQTLVLTVDVPQVSRRLRDQRNGFNVPFQMTPRAFIDFASHPRWSLSTLAAGIPSPQNVGAAGACFDRKANRAGADWQFLSLLREHWRGTLIVKGVSSAMDAKRVCDSGADAIYVSNHGARQLDSVPASLDLLMAVRAAVAADFPLLFDSGVRNGEDVIKALVCGADFVMLGRAALLALGADGERGLNTLLDGFCEDISVVLAQLGVCNIAALRHEMIAAGQ